MRLVRTRLGGGIFVFATAAIATLVVIACATGTDGAVLDDGEGGPIGADGSTLDVTVLPGRDSSVGGDTGTLPGEDSSTGACTKKVVINELQTRTAAGASAEFIELYNPNTCSVTMGAWKVAYKSSAGNGNGVLHTFASGQTLAAGAYLVLGTSLFAGQKDVTFAGGMADDGQIALQDDTDKNVDAVGFGSSTGPFVEGSAAQAPTATASVGRKANGVDTDNNSADFKTANPTPGAAN